MAYLEQRYPDHHALAPGLAAQRARRLGRLRALVLVGSGAALTLVGLAALMLTLVP